MTAKRTHIVLPGELVEQIDAIVGRRGRSSFLKEAAAKELRRLRLLRVLEQAEGAWKIEKHPELKGGAAAWVRKQRQLDEKRFERIGKVR